MGKLRRAIGLMSGTSLDGIDVALLETDGETVGAFGPARSYPYNESIRRLLRVALADALLVQKGDERPGSLATAEIKLTELHISAVEHFLMNEGLAPTSIDVIGFHGQTVLHRPEAGLTVQLGLGERMADALKIPVVFDMRSNDVAEGGQGAPLAPAYHRALVTGRFDLPIAFVNIGGVANVSFVGADGSLMAFDTGPGNALIDDLISKANGLAFDDGGKLALSGTINEPIVEDYLANDYFQAPVPKSLDRNAFDIRPVSELSTEDGLATLTAFTVRAIIEAQRHFPSPPKSWIVSGGGRLNNAILQALSRGVAESVLTAEQAGFRGDSIEAEAWAFLAVRSCEGLPLTYPGTTGVSCPVTGGTLAQPAARRTA